MKRQFDKLKEINHESIDYEQYFGEMDLTEEEKEKRIKLAERFEILFLFFFVSFLEDKDRDYQSMIHEKYVEIAMTFLSVERVPDYIDSYAGQISKDIMQTTEENADSDYYTSPERARFISANEANLVGNYAQEVEAIKSGKRYKTWSTMKDRKVRHTHVSADEKKIGIFELFEIGNSLMMFPKDGSQGAEAGEIVNCRCTVRYS